MRERETERERERDSEQSTRGMSTTFKTIPIGSLFLNVRVSLVPFTASFNSRTNDCFYLDD